MRYLSKIVFINSAHVRHEAIHLDGNVHFIGTQGVGKSTLLRAVLFFYNADKQHLGIRSGQKSFDEFYFPYANSYILYEVARKHGAYTILVSRHQGRAVFRFIDAPYNDEWLVDEQGEVSSDWVTIRQRIAKGGVDISAVIDRYDWYRDIIFGNTHDRSHKYDKYAIVESSKYQNIPRSIQNVFLNSRLDADFVKDTIIQSMTEGETALGLQAFRSLIKRFEDEYKDIRCWYAKDKNGEIPVRMKANLLIERYREVVAMELQIVQIWKQLNSAVAKAKEQLPLDEENLRGVREQTAKVVSKLQDLKDEFEKEKDSIVRHIGELDGKLKTIREKKKKYAELKIELLLERAKNEAALKNSLEHEQDVYNSLVKQYGDIEEKYKQLSLAIENKHNSFETRLNETLNFERNQLQMQRDKYTDEKEKNLKIARKNYEDAIAQIDARLESMNQERMQLQEAITKIQLSHPHAQGIQTCKDELQEMAVIEKSGESRMTAIENEIARLRTEANAELSKEQITLDNQARELNEKRNHLRERLSDVDDKLNRWSGSLYEWLCTNKPGWEQTIGKVVDEDRVLYQSGLNPENIGGDTLFGVKLDVNIIESAHRSPDEYRQERANLIAQIEVIQRQLADIESTKGDVHKRIEAKLSKALNPLQQEKTTLRVTLEAIPGKKRIKEMEVLRLQQQESEEKEALVKERNTEMSALIAKIATVKDEKKQKKDWLDKEEVRLENVLKNAMKPCEEKLKSLKAQQDQERKEEQVTYSAQMAQLNADRNRELTGKGADTQMIDRQNEVLVRLKQQLKQIEDERPMVFAYNKDNEEWLSQEGSFHSEKKQFEEKQRMLTERYKDKQSKYVQQRDTLLNEDKRLSRQIETFKDGLEQYRRFVEIEKSMSEHVLYITNTNATTKDIQTLLSEEKGAIYGRTSKFNALKVAVNQFNSHFESDNLFSFNTVPAQDDDYIQIATNLEEFIAQNKIEEYRTRTNALYKDLIQRIAREVGDLTQYTASVDKIIQEINRDFSEKKFAGVIRSIELRSEDSNDKMMQLLQSIKSFVDENMLSIGEMNLFSGDNRDAVNEKVVDYLSRLMRQLQQEPTRTQISIGDTFRLQFRVKENDNDTGWVERINNVGSNGTDTLVKAMVNIMLINVFKKRATRGKDDLIIHCMMDEIGTLHPDNIHGILQFANSRNIYLVNGSPTTENAYDYKYTYMLDKGPNSQTKIACLSIVHQNE